MEDQRDNSTLLTVVIIVLAAIVILWIIWRLDQRDAQYQNCYGATPDPVGNVQCQSLGPGEIKICWDPTPNATHYRLYINTAPPPVVTSGTNCCPTECDACVSQSNYSRVIETDKTEVIVQTCEPSICYTIVGYNFCGQAGPCSSVYTCEVECIVDEIEAWVYDDHCVPEDTLKIGWNCPLCCETIHIYIDGSLVASVPSSDKHWETSPKPADGLEIAIACESQCGLGAQNVLVSGAT